MAVGYDAGMRNSDWKTFGAYIRKLRQQRKLRITEVAELSGDISETPRGTISQPHLSKLEAGKPIQAPVEKLITLAAAYDVTVSDLVAKAPPDYRLELREQLRKLRRSEFVWPKPVRYLPRDVKAANNDVFYALESSTDLDYLAKPSDASMYLMRAIIVAILPAYLPRNGELLTTYWTDCFKPCDFDPDAIHPTRFWFRRVEELRDYLLYDRRLGPDVVSQLDSWSLSMMQYIESLYMIPLTCTFKDPAQQATLGVAAIPVVAVAAARWRQTAHLLHAALPSDWWIRKPPPPPGEALLDYCAAIVHGTSYQPVLEPLKQAELLPRIAAAVAARRDGKAAKKVPPDAAPLVAFFAGLADPPH